MCKIQNTDYTTFTFNNSVYNVSYGLNIFPIDFGSMNASYTITISQDDVNDDVFDWISVQPLYIKSDNIDVNLETPTNILFYAGGMISILLLPNFTYNCLYLEVDDTVINEMYTNYSNYEEVDSAFLIATMFDGVYLQYDLNLIPSQHVIKIKGNGTLDYKIISLGDWDNDYIYDIEEIQNEPLDSRYDPLVSNIWGYFEMGSSYMNIENYQNETAMFRFYIPEDYNGLNYLSMNIRSGRIENIIIDDDPVLNNELSTTLYEKPISYPIGIMTSGFHIVQYKYRGDMETVVSFAIDGRPIFILPRPESRDTDADGVKDIQEQNQWSYISNPDTDYDGITDNFDDSPITSLSLNKGSIYQFILPHNSSKNTFIDISIKRPKVETDYYTEDSKIWNGMEVRIHPIIRQFGNSTITITELEETWAKEIISYNLTDTYSPYGDGIVNPEDEQGEIVIVPAKITETSFSFSLVYGIGHSAKIDSIIDLRFDIVWGVYSTSANTTKIIHFYDFDDDIIIQSISMKEVQNVSYILANPDSHIENEVLWNLVKNDNLGSFTDFGVNGDVVGSGNVDYLNLSTHLIADRGNDPISTDISGDINENEVLFTSLIFSSMDVLFKIYTNMNLTDSPEIFNYYGERETFLSYYSVSPICDEDLTTLIYGETIGEIEIGYIKSWDAYNLNKTEMEYRTNLLNFPVDMNSIDFQSSVVLEISSVSGCDIPENKFPYSLSEVSYDKICITNTTIIEKDTSTSGIPELCFDYENDEFKQVYDNRLFDVPFSNLIFHEYSVPVNLRMLRFWAILNDEIDNFRAALSGLNLDFPFLHYFARFEKFKDFYPDIANNYAILNYICEGYKNFAPDYFPTWYTFLESIEYESFTTFGKGLEDLWKEDYFLGDDDPSEIFNTHPWLREVNSDGAIISYFDDVLIDIQDTRIAPMERLRLLNELGDYIKTHDVSNFRTKLQESTNYLLNLDVEDLLNSDVKKQHYLYLKRVTEFERIQGDSLRWIEKTKQDIYKVHNDKIRKQFHAIGRRKLLAGIGASIGSILLIISAFMDFNEIIRNKQLTIEEGIFRLAYGITKLAISGLLMAYSIECYIESYRAFKVITGKTLTNSMKVLGVLMDIFSIGMATIDLISAIFEITQIYVGFTEFVKITLEVIRWASIVIPEFISLCYILAGSTGPVGGYFALIGLTATIGWILWDLILNWLNPRPTPVASVKISDDPNETYFELPTADTKRHGSLEVGDQVKFHLNVTRDGTVDAWMRACFSAGESDWSADQGKWTGDGYDTQGESAEYTFTRTLPNTQRVTELKTDIEIDMYINGRENIYDEITTWYVDIPILDSNIAWFHGNLTDFDKPNSYDELIREYESLKDTYKYKDTSDILSILKNRTEWDFLNDTVGQIPSGWNKNEVDKGVFKLLPNGDDLDAYCWSDSTGEDYYTEINETEKYWGSQLPLSTIGWRDGDCYFDEGWDGYEVRFDFPTINDFTTCTNVKVHILARGDADVGEYTNCRISHNGDDWTNQQPELIDGDWDWYMYSFSSISWSDIDDFQVELECPDTTEVGNYADIDVLYAEFICTNSEANAPSIINSQSGHNNVMSIEIYGQDASCNFYRDLSPSRTSGNVDFWMYKDNYSLIDIDMFYQIDEFGNIYQSDGETLIYAPGVHSFIWNHFKIEYNSTDFDLYLNGIKIGNDITHSKTDFYKIEFIAFNDFDCENEIKSTITHVYLDSIDVSWKNNYYDWRSYSWDYSLDNISYYDNLYDDLIIYTNIDSDLSENIVEMDTDTDEAIFSFDLDLDGSDNPTVNISLSTSDDFTLNETLLTQTLNSEINFKVTANDKFHFAGVYYIDMNITYSGTEIYFERIPFRIPLVEDFSFNQSNIIFEETNFNGNYTATATYDFKGDAGGDPIGWTVYEYGGTANVISSLEEHVDVLELHDTSSTTYTGAGKSLSSAQISGTVEFWMRIDDATKGVSFRGTNAPQVGVLFGIYDDKFMYWKNGGWKNTTNTIIPQDNQWYHIKIEFECGSGEYQGLSADTFRVYIDEVCYGVYDFNNAITDIDQIQFCTYSPKMGYYGYIDAIGCSWDSDYKLGENLYKTDLTTGDYGSSTELNKGDILNIEYKTNSYNEATMTFLNNDQIQASYTVVPRGNLYEGIQFDQIIIKETFSFDEIEFLGIKGYNYFEISKISIIDADLSISQQFNPLNFTNMGNTPKFVAFSFSGVPFENVSQSLYPDEFFGETQVAIILPNTTRISNFDIIHPTESISNLFWRGITYTESGTGNIYNIYVDNLEIDGIYVVSPEKRSHNIIGDAISSGKYEFHLDIIPEEDLVWSAYSFNGGANITFTDTANITLPEEDGMYSIQVFGNNSGGTIFQSEVRNFTISYPIKILSPEKKTPYNPEGILFYIDTIISVFNESEYSLDGFGKKPFENNNTINCCIGDHSIIIYGNDTYGDEYRSEKYSFTVLPVYIAPSQPDNFTFNIGSLQTPYGDLETIDGNYSNFISTAGVKEFINSVSYLHGSCGGGSLANTHTDDSNYYQMNSEYEYQVHWVSVTFNFNPTLAGRDFYISTHIDTTSSAIGYLYINGQLQASGIHIDFDHELKTGVNSITFQTYSETTAHNSKMYYFKLVENPPDLDVQVDMQVEDPNCYSVNSLQYSHRTNISATVDLDIWNWGTSSWNEIESVDNSVNFDDDSFTLANNSAYLNSTFGVRIRFQALNQPNEFQLEIDRLRLEYAFTIGSIIHGIPSQPDNFTFNDGSLQTPYGDLEIVDGNYSV